MYYTIFDFLFVYIHDLHFLIIIHFIQSKSSMLNSSYWNNCDGVSIDAVVDVIQASLTILCDISSSIPVLNKRNPFLGKNAFIKSGIGSLLHTIVIQSENKQLKWCKKIYANVTRSKKYNELENLVLYDDRLDYVHLTLSQVKRSEIEVMDCTILHNWCSNTRRKMTAGTWMDQTDYDSTIIYDAHRHYIANLGYGLKSE